MDVWSEEKSKGKRGMRLLIIHPALAPYRIDLFNALAARTKCKVLFLKRRALRHQFDQEALVQQLGAKFEYLDAGFNVSNRTIRFGIGKEIRRFRPHVVVTHEFSPTTAMVSLIKKRSETPFRHLVYSEDFPPALQGEPFWRRWARRVLLPRLDGLILYTKAAEAYYRRHFEFDGTIGITPNIQDENRFRRDLEEAGRISDELRNKYDLDTRRMVLFVGRLWPEKNVPTLLRAFQKLRALHPQTVLVLVGTGPDEVALRRQVQTMEMTQDVIFTGMLEGLELYAHYRLADVMVLPSIHEPFGAVVNEALLAGVPVVCSQVAGASSLIREGRNGSLVDPKDESALTAAIGVWIGRTADTRRSENGELPPNLMPMQFEEVVKNWLEVSGMETES